MGIAFTHLIKIEYFTIFAHIIEQLTKLGKTVWIIDLSLGEVISSTDRFKSSRASLIDEFYRFIFSRNLNVIALSPSLENSTKNSTLRANRANRRVTLNDIIESAALTDAEEIGVRSFFSTHELRSNNGNVKVNNYFMQQFNGLINEMNYVKSGFTKTIPKLGLDYLIIQNGRWRSQVCLVELCKTNRITALYVNTGADLERSYVLSDFMLQDVVSFQNWGAKYFVFPNLEKLDKKSYLEKWIDGRRNTEGIFNADVFLGRVSKRIPKVHGRKTAIVASSSSSEFDFFSNHDLFWESQAHALGYACKVLKQQGYHVVLRLHPNTFNYSWYDFQSVFTACKPFVDEVFFPWSTQSTYALLEESSLIVVWESSIGLEGAVMGKPSISLCETYYSVLLDSTVAKSPKTFEEAIANGIKVADPNKAFNTVYFLNNFGAPFPPETVRGNADFRKKLVSFEVDRKKQKRSRWSHFSAVLYKSDFFRNHKSLAPKEVFLILQKVFGTKLAIKIMERITQENFVVKNFSLFKVKRGEIQKSRP